MDEIRKITTELAKIDEGKVKAIAEGDKVYLMIQDALAELRRLADALEKIDVREIKALVAYAKPTGRKTSARQPAPAPKPIETSFPSPLAPAAIGSASAADETRVAELLDRFRARARKVELASLDGRVVRVWVTGAAADDVERLRADVRAAIENELPGAHRVEFE